MLYVMHARETRRTDHGRCSSIVTQTDAVCNSWQTVARPANGCGGCPPATEWSLAAQCVHPSSIIIHPSILCLLGCVARAGPHTVSLGVQNTRALAWRV